MRLTLERRRWIWAYLFLVVPLVFFLSIRIGPTLYAFWMSLHEWDPIALDRPFIGLENFRELGGDETFWKALRNTWVYVLVGVPAGLVISLLVALGLQRLVRFVGAYRVLYFLPYITSLVAVGWVWRWMYMPNGLFNDILGSLGLPTSKFLGSPDTAIYAIIATTVWHGLGFQVVIFLAGLESIPQDYLDAAAVDGANAWQRFRFVTLPGLGSMIRLSVFFSLLGSLQFFDMIVALTKGGPLNSTHTMVSFLYYFGIGRMKVGFGSAVGVVLFILCASVAFGYKRIFMKDD